MADRAQAPGKVGEAARRNRERIAAGDDQFPNLLMRRQIGEGSIERGIVEHAGRSRADPRTAEAETAIDRADTGQFEQSAVGIAMDQALARLMDVVADRVDAFLRQKPQFGNLRQELPTDRIVGPLDQSGDAGRHGDAVMRRDLGQFRRLPGRGQAGRDQFLGSGQCFAARKFAHGRATGAQRICSIFSAPVASMTSRSSPSAMPLEGGIFSSAARKSSSSG